MDILCYEPFVPLIFVKITAILFKHSFCVPDDVYSMVRLELSTFHFYTHYEMTLLKPSPKTVRILVLDEFYW